MVFLNFNTSDQMGKKQKRNHSYVVAIKWVLLLGIVLFLLFCLSPKLVTKAKKEDSLKLKQG